MIIFYHTFDDQLLLGKKKNLCCKMCERNILLDYSDDKLENIKVNTQKEIVNFPVIKTFIHNKCILLIANSDHFMGLLNL